MDFIIALGSIFFQSEIILSKVSKKLSLILEEAQTRKPDSNIFKSLMFMEILSQ